ncbi:MAG: hypothetical protein WC742_15215 [Gallionellaceae bacterium]|jgi:hypothetical protein
MEIPVHQVVANLLSQLDACQQEEFEERAGIIEASMKIDRGHAECLALLDLFTSYPVVVITNKSAPDISVKTDKSDLRSMRYLI